MSTFFNISATAFLIADPSRAAMLTMLMDGRAHPAGVLARAAGVSAQTASAHLAKLRAGGLVLVETEGRHRYYRLADSHVAQALEQLAAIRPGATPRPMALSPQQRSLRFCRRCYDHLAGQVAVAVTCALLDQDYLQPEEDRRFIVTPAGARWFSDLGLDVEAIRPTRRGLARQCLDWTERVPHLAGPLGVQFMSLLCERGWLRRSDASRAVLLTPAGAAGLRETLGVMLP